MEIGDRVLLAVGAPFGLAGSVTHGIISAKGRAGLHMNMYEDFLQTDAAINPGNSGGPLVSLEGKVVGINAAIKSKSGGFQGVGLAVASNLAKNIVPALRTDGVVSRELPRHGRCAASLRRSRSVSACPRTASESSSPRSMRKPPPPRRACKRETSSPPSPARPSRTAACCAASSPTLPLGKPAAVEIIRAGKAQELAVTIEEQPAE